MLANSGFTDEEIAEVTAHESVKTTQGYQNADDLPYMPVHIQINNLKSTLHNQFFYRVFLQFFYS